MKFSVRFICVRLIVTIGLLCPGAALRLMASASEQHAPLPKEALAKLNRAMKASDLYMRDRTSSLDSLTRCLAHLPASDSRGRWEMMLRLSADYLPMRADSALRYSEMALLIAPSTGVPEAGVRSRRARINARTTCGIFTRALEEFTSIDSHTLPEGMRLDYWSAGRKLFGYMRAYVEGDVQFFNDYSERYIQYDDSLIKHLPADDPTRTFYMAERLVNHGRFSEAKGMLDRLCTTLPEEANLYGMAAFQLALVSKSEGDQTSYAAYLADAATADIKGCIKDGLALPTLAEWLYRQGELSDAFRYINFALEDAMEGNVRMRTVTIASLLPVIDEAYREKINASRDELMVYFLLVTFLLIVTVTLVVVLMRNIKRSRLTAAKLERTSEIQESYIGHFIGLCSSYASRLQSLQQLVGRKLASGQGDELLKLVKSGKFSSDQSDDFYRIFDSAFFDIYPDFLENMNALLRPEEAIELKSENELTPELRIYALVRLGVDESTRIAQMLNYSVSTVYAYRNRMRNRAIDRDNFDRNVVRIGKRKKADDDAE